MIPAGSQQKHTNVSLISERYDVHRDTAYKWTGEPGFPSAVDRAGKAEVYDEDEVDEWLRKNFPGVWIKGQKGRNPLGLPPGGDRDLLPLRRIGELEGRAFNRKATEVGTLRTYISKGILARPDRRPGDGQRPEVTEDMWFRSTAYAYLNRPRRTRRQPDSERQPQAAGGPGADLELPGGDDQDLLTLEEIRAIDTAARGRPAPKAATLKAYQSDGRMPRPDRVPGDGEEPAVDEPMWYRSTAYGFIRSRPAARRTGTSGAERSGPDQLPQAAGGLRNDLELPGGDDEDLLTLEQIRAIDTAARGRPAPKASTLKVYQSDGRMPRPDRVPGDGEEPAVDEPMWYRSTAYRFVRRPATGRPRGSSKAARGESHG
ncbi:hypothetical protein OIE82_34860 (plasmid) [Streptomyces althioticus]|uniref:Uncharacterized protein n=1 Tax=Streptomyces althioticus TaxID=83380 RepID=A0ABZ1YFK2_9ACTN|nr:hypothetical protein OIE99_34975 [Streptomyces cellulosae]WTC60842.1 hypothetical protein OH715_36725 [Streptomyces cellulosae]